MGGASRSLAGLLAIVLLWPSDRVRGDVQGGVERYHSGEAVVTLEWFAPASQGKFPAVVMLHGSGGLDPGTALMFREVARGFAERGYVALIPHYFERTGHEVGGALKPDELKSFVEAVTDGIEFGIGRGIVDQDRIGMMGYSMGAYIAFSRGARDPRIKAIVSVAGGLPVESRSKFPPVLILQGSNDHSNPVARVKAFQEVLKAQGTPYASRIYKGMGHNFDADRWEDAAVRAAAFFDRHMRSPRTTKSKKSLRARNSASEAGDAKSNAAKGDVPKDDGTASPDPFAPPNTKDEVPADPPKPPRPSGGPAA
jgi:dienelactone hydrolase